MYENMTYEKILESMFARMPGMDSREGSVTFDSVAAVAYSLEEVYFALENYLNLVFADTSAGEFLDRFAVLINVERKEAVKAVRKGKFDREIDLGARFSTAGDTPLIYTVVEYGGEEDGAYTYLLECETAGKAGNEYFGNLIPVEYINGLGQAVLSDIEINGADRETDEAFRERLLNRMQRPSTSGNVNDYYNWTMAYAGVGAAKIFPLDNGPGTVGVVIVNQDKEAADDSLVSSVAAYIETVRPIGASVTVESAAQKTINIRAKVRLATETILGTAQYAFQEAVETYLRENVFGIEYVSLAKIGSLLMGVAGVEDYTELTLNGEEENVFVGEKEIGVIGTVRLEAIIDGSQ